MKALFFKEIRYFFTSAIGYILIAVFMLTNALFLWILRGNYNIFETGFSDLYPFFTLSAWIFVFLIPAVTMRSLSEEKRTGMLPLLLTKPIKSFEIIIGKYFAILTLIVFILIFSLLFVFIVWKLGNPVGNLDVGSTIGSYIALFLLASAFASIGLWASSLTENQIVAFSLATFINFLLFFGIDEIISLFSPNFLVFLGFKNHFEEISRGVIDSRNIVYFLLVIAFFLYNATLLIKSEKK